MLPVTRRNDFINSINKNLIYYCLINLLLLISITGHPNNHNSHKNRNSNRTIINISHKNLISYETLSDGELEKLIQYNGLTAKETSVRPPPGNSTAKSMKLRQVTDGSHIIQMIYGSDGTLKDCELVRQRAAVKRFLSTFKETLHSRRNITELPDGTFLPQDISSWLNFDLLKSVCKRNKRLLKKIAARRKTPPQSVSQISFNKTDHRTRVHHRTVNSTTPQRRRHRADSYIERSGMLLAPGTKWCGHSDSADTISSFGPFSTTDRCCRNHDLCPLSVGGLEQKYNFFNYRPFTISHCSCDSRRRRDIMEVLLVPGTKWCGRGSSATKRSQLGSFGAADKCCRAHDTACPFYIPAFEQRYGLYNWRVSTLMHCSCDSRFRACLKMANTGTSHLVGKLFFNVVQTKCFVLKPEKVCVKRSWKGKCQKYEYRKQAHLRDNPSF